MNWMMNDYKIVGEYFTAAKPCRKFKHVHPQMGLVTPSVHKAADHMVFFCLIFIKTTMRNQ